ncbi:hypothetical protein [Stratiformator vulcanicus]|uniref:Uncharacterized protein n=1 Tax=Stratiformator vulcanicus TaxID=2527980 RepID=A0A517R5Q8_9PLAN|nr:hypothetical protein [Stratiformator vulcanicus]QDT39227.1 hypothetical protein Pan189_36300 [Stratiformator vulcanicus]
MLTTMAFSMDDVISFCEEHGGYDNLVMTEDGRRAMLPDGSYLEVSNGLYVMRWRPDPLTLDNPDHFDHHDLKLRVLSNQKQYWQTRLNRAVREFDDLRDRAKRGIAYGSVPSPDIERQLIALKGMVEEYREELAKVDNELNPPPSPEQLAADKAQADALSAALERLNQILI